MGTSTKRRILDAAEHLFADLGYAGASVRQITSKAGVDLGAVRYHFGSKEKLFASVVERRVRPLCDERLRLLETFEEQHADGVPPQLIVEAFVRPGVRLVTDAEHGRDWIKLIGRIRVEPGPFVSLVQESYEKMLGKFLDAFRKALPEIPEDEIAYRFFFLFGVQINTLIDDGTLHALGHDIPTVHQDPDAVIKRLIAFVDAGMRAPCESDLVEEPHLTRMRLG